MALYAAYGTNLDASRMLRLAPHSPTRGTGWLSGWRLTFAGEDIGWDGPKATIVEDPTSQVYVALYDVTPADEETMDEFERAVLGGATKIRLRVHTLDGDPLAWVYVMDAYEGGLPTASYLGELAEAAEVAGAPDDYVADLRARPCRSDG
ncbi:gamma-glutamylcyclotransferase [Angustibacter aerolatus]